MRQEPRGPTQRDLAIHADVLARLAADEGGSSDKLQSRLERIERLWRPVQAAYTIRDVIEPRRGVAPNAEHVALVAGFRAHACREVRQRVVNALRHARTHSDIVLPVLRGALRDGDLLVQSAGARAAYEMRLGVELTAELLKAIDAPTWTIRVYAAAALASTPHLERAAETFFASSPARGQGSGAERASEIWSSLCVAFPPESEGDRPRCRIASNVLSAKAR
jgi:hypothetical protein